MESISKLIHVIKTWEMTMLFVREFFNSLSHQWNLISHHRIDKFLMFVRRFVRQVLFALKNNEWNSHNVELFSDELYNALQILPIGLVNHISDIYIEEMAKVSAKLVSYNKGVPGNISEKTSTSGVIGSG